MLFRSSTRPGSPMLQPKTNSYDVESHVEELKHNFMVNLGRFFIGFDSWKSARSFSIDYDVYAANLPDKVEGKLHVIVEIGHELS